MSNCSNCAEFSEKVIVKQVYGNNLTLQVNKILQYSNVEVIRFEPYEKTEIVLESILGFI